MRRSRRILTLTAALSCLAITTAACSGSSGDTGAASGAGGPSGNGKALSFDRKVYKLASALQPFSACDDLLGYLRKEATTRVTAYGLPGTGGYGYGGIGIMEDASKSTGAFSGPITTMAGSGAAAPVAANAAGQPQATTAAADGSGRATGDYSNTNVVEAGIDEGDTVKTDGSNVYLLSQGRLRILRAGRGETAGSFDLAGSLDLHGYGTQLVQVGTQLLIAGQPIQDEPSPDAAGKDSAGLLPRWGGNQNALWQIDVSDPAAPRVVRQLIVDGSVLSIRLTGEVARVVLQSPPQGLDFVNPSGPGSDARALATNKAVIAESSIDDWLGRYRLLDDSGKELAAGSLADCQAIGRPRQFHGFSTTTVLSIDLTKDLAAPDGAAVLADGQQVYASAGSLYVAIGAWQDPISATTTVESSSNASDGSRAATKATTAIHRFSFEGAHAVYRASGEVDGSLMNDFSMSELDGVLRVATTAGTPWETNERSESFVTTLRVSDGELVQAGRLGGLGRGEQIRAVRFLGANGYVVTFRQTDPLYVVDLRDPAAPKLAGELELDGYSGYLHPMADGRILGVGSSADPDGRITGAQVSVFDVSDPSAPRRDAVYQLAGAGLNAEWDYHSFLWWEPEHLALMTGTAALGESDSLRPFDGGDRSLVLGLEVGDTIRERGRIRSIGTGDGSAIGCPQPVAATATPNVAAAPDTTLAPTPSVMVSPPSCFPYQAPITRTMIVGGSILAISDSSVQVNDLKSFAPQRVVQLG